MKRKWILLKISLFFIALILLLSFANSRYKLRDVEKVNISIDYKDNNHFINNNIVDSLLKKVHRDYPKMAMQKVDQQAMEKVLIDNEFISNANVYLENNGILHANISQEKPIARVKDGATEYYITEKEEKINLSNNFTANTLLISGKIKLEDYKGVVKLSNLINNDELLKNLIIGMRKIKDNSFILLVDDDYHLELGDLENLEDKLENYKVFYNKYIKETAEIPYKKLNLRFKNQIVATK